MRIQVTAQHISDGMPNDGMNCPVALAIREATGLNGVEVGPTYVTRDDWKGRTEPVTKRTFLPPHVTEAIADFDAGTDPEPFEFDLDIDKLRFESEVK